MCGVGLVLIGCKSSPGPQGLTGPAGSPDTPAQVLQKITQVDGADSGLDADLLDGRDSTAFQSRITGTCGQGSAISAVGADGTVTCTAASSHIIQVPAAGSPSANGAALISAMNGLSPSAASPYLVKLEPGTYDLGSETLPLKAYVDLEGSGEERTIVSKTGDTALVDAVSLGVPDGRPEVRALTLSVSGQSVLALALQGAAITLQDMKVAASGTTGAEAIFLGGSSSLIARNVRVSATGATSIGMELHASKAEIWNSQVSVTGNPSTGLYIGETSAAGLRLTEIDAPLSGSGTAASIFDGSSFFATGGLLAGTQALDGALSHTQIANEELFGPVSAGADVRCVGSYSDDLTPRGADCQ